MKYELKDSKEFKTEKLVEYFTDKKRIDVTDKNYASAIKLDKMIYLFNKDIDTLSKYYQMNLIFKNVGDFIKEYKYLKDFLDQSSVYYLDVYVEEIAVFLNRIEKGLNKEVLKDYLVFEKNRYFEDYRYAEYFVSEYVNYNESPYLRDYLNEYGLQEQDFIRFTCIISEFNEELFNKYLEKNNSNQISRKSEIERKMSNIKEGVTTGFTKDGEKFDAVEFYANMPFDDQESAREIIDDFGCKKMATIDKKFRCILETLYPESSREVMSYIYSNNLLTVNPTKINEREIRETIFINNNEALSVEGKEEIITYMKERKIPFLHSAFNAVKSKYLQEGLKINKEKTLEK